MLKSPAAKVDGRHVRRTFSGGNGGGNVINKSMVVELKRKRNRKCGYGG